VLLSCGSLNFGFSPCSLTAAAAAFCTSSSLSALADLSGLPASLLLRELCFCFLLVLRLGCSLLLLRPAGVTAPAGRFRTKLPVLLMLSLLLLVALPLLLLQVTGCSCWRCC
jgi:hypothetical protein